MLGFLFALTSALLFGVSAVMQKYSMKHMRKFSVKRIINMRFWQLSVLLGLGGMFFYLAAMRLANIAVVQPLASLSIVITSIAGHLIFNEKIDTMWFHIILIVVGVVLLSL
ncbi:MAG: EamA family transporter [Candidatus Aenigmarchaeota archaeon]|nr:EamA family transporter [Candidatus Aenigmarchaeota archaeon]